MSQASQIILGLLAPHQRAFAEQALNQANASPVVLLRRSSARLNPMTSSEAIRAVSAIISSQLGFAVGFKRGLKPGHAQRASGPMEAPRALTPICRSERPDERDGPRVLESSGQGLGLEIRPGREMDACQHTANRAACELKRRDIERKKFSAALEHCQLVWQESLQCT